MCEETRYQNGLSADGDSADGKSAFWENASEKKCWAAKCCVLNYVSSKLILLIMTLAHSSSFVFV